MPARLQSQYPDLEIRPVRKVSASEGQVLDKIKGLMGLVSLVILALSSLCVNTTLMAIVGERAREFALQKALGASNGDIVRQILLETCIIALAAVVCGWLLGYLLAQLLGLTVFNAAISLRLPGAAHHPRIVFTGRHSGGDCSGTACGQRRTR